MFFLPNFLSSGFLLRAHSPQLYVPVVPSTQNFRLKGKKTVDGFEESIGLEVRLFFFFTPSLPLHLLFLLNEGIELHV